MTLCLAAISYEDACIVTASDVMLSNDSMGSEETLAPKCQLVSQDGEWLMMFAGDPTVRVEVVRRTKVSLPGGGYDVQHVSAAVETAYREVLRHKIEGEILSRFGMTREEFLKIGRDQLGDDLFARLAYRIESASLDTDFLLAGFDPKGSARMFSVCDPGVVEDHHDSAGFYAIGTGATVSLASPHHAYGPMLTMPDLV